MPFSSKSQQRWMFATHPEMAKRWAAHTPNMKKLPEKKTDEHKKKAFVLGLLLKCASEGRATPGAVRELAEAMLKEAQIPGAESFGQALGWGAGAAPSLALLGTVGIPLAAGAGAGGVYAAARNSADAEDEQTVRLRALANAYRRKADEARVHAQVKELVAKHPRDLIPLG